MYRRTRRRQKWLINALSVPRFGEAACLTVVAARYTGNIRVIKPAALRIHLTTRALYSCAFYFLAKCTWMPIQVDCLTWHWFQHYSFWDTICSEQPSFGRINHDEKNLCNLSGPGSSVSLVLNSNLSVAKVFLFAGQLINRNIVIFL